MTIDKEKLKPCPFCGGEVQMETVKSRAGTLYGVVCRNTGNRGCTCAMEQVPSRTAEAAIARWNMRKPMDQLEAENEALRKDAERYRFVRELAWYVDQAALVYELGNSRSPWAGERLPVDADEVEEAIDAAMVKEADE